MGLTIFHLYPDTMNIYGDGGNVLTLKRRCEWRGIDVEVVGLGLRNETPFDRCDLLFMGGGQDNAQAMIAEDLKRRADEVKERIERGMPALTICGAYQLFGKSFTTADGQVLPGLGIFDVDTVAGRKRMIGDVIINTDLDHEPWLNTGSRGMLVGFENHGGVTRLGAEARPLGRVVRGCGNAPDGTFEGVVQNRAVGTYLHGPVLPKNPWLADRLIAAALEHRLGRGVELAELDDRLEYRAQKAAMDRCIERRRARPRVRDLVGM